MNFFSNLDILKYCVVCLVLFVIFVIYYNLQKPQKIKIIDTYKKHILNNNEPAVAFTYAKVTDTLYENYYADLSEEGKIILNSQLEEYPINPDGTRFSPTPHGELTEETSEGYMLSGIGNRFLCPQNWQWDSIAKKCINKPICQSDIDVFTFKGLDYYNYFNIFGNQSKRRELTTDQFHDRLYVWCKDTGIEYLECQDNSIYNKKPTQPDTENPCVLYDICLEKNNYDKHKTNIDDTKLTEQQYYMCLNKKSILMECDSGFIYNSSTTLCQPNDI